VTLLSAFLSISFKTLLLLIAPMTWILPEKSKLRQFVSSRSTTAWKETKKLCQHASDRAAAEGLDLYWFHVASAGELEQAVPLARSLLAQRRCGFVVTYTSPSTEPFLPNVPGLLVSFPHPLFDEKRLQYAQKTLKPRAVFLIRYDFWPSIFRVAKEHCTPLYLVGATAQKAATGIRAHLHILQRKSHYLRQFAHIFAISPNDAQALSQTAGPNKVSMAGEPKWVRAKERAREPLPSNGPLPVARTALASFRAITQKPVIIFGSPHREEWDICKMCIESAEAPFMIVVAPHDTDPTSIEKWTRSARGWGAQVVTLSQLAPAIGQQSSQSIVPEDPEIDCNRTEITRQVGHANPTLRLLERAQMLPEMGTKPLVLIADGVGYLAQLYGLCDIAVVGGGFDGGLHNCLEPAAQGLATLFGNRFERAPEATVLIKNGAARSFATTIELFQFLNQCASVSRPDASRGVGNQECARLSVHAVQLFEAVPDTSLIILQHLDNAEGHKNVLPEGSPPQQTHASHKTK
jgi:3-deoxy-D-manno-octulosonic-acid transferase